MTRKNAAVCGTNGGYQRHRRQGEEPCDPCREAKSAYNRAYNAERRQRPPEPETFTIQIRCPYCGGPTTEINRRSYRGELIARIKCAGPHNCRYELAVRAIVVPVAMTDDLEPSRCGTEAGARRHFRNQEPLCDSCATAHSQQVHDHDHRRISA